MLIVALQDDVDNLYAIWNTVTDRFLGVNLDRDFAMDAIIQYKHCSIAEANSRLDNPQPFSDIAKLVDWGIAYKRPGSNQYSYIIYSKKFYEVTGFYYGEQS